MILPEEVHHDAKSVQAPTLMGAYYELQENIARFEAIIELAEKITRKFDRTDDRPQVEPDRTQQLEKAAVAKDPNLVSLFMQVSGKLHEQTEVLGANLTKVIHQIE